MEPHHEPQGSPRGPRIRPKVKEKEQSVSSQLSVLPGSTFSHKAGFVTLITGVSEGIGLALTPLFKYILLAFK